MAHLLSSETLDIRFCVLIQNQHIKLAWGLIESPLYFKDGWDVLIELNGILDASHLLPHCLEQTDPSLMTRDLLLLEK